MSCLTVEELSMSFLGLGSYAFEHLGLVIPKADAFDDLLRRGVQVPVFWFGTVLYQDHHQQLLPLGWLISLFSR